MISSRMMSTKSHSTKEECRHNKTEWISKNLQIYEASYNKKEV